MALAEAVVLVVPQVPQAVDQDTEQAVAVERMAEAQVVAV